jgi:ABC-type branched-subunit amino acid transport system ATPase component
MTALAGLRTVDLTVRYGAVTALDAVTLDVPRGEVVGLIGPNGAGKTTFIDAVTGFTPSSGIVTLDGRPLGGMSVHRRVRAGLARTFQTVELFDDLTIEENLTVAGTRTTARDLRARVRAVLARLELSDAAHQHPRELSQGRQRLAGIARALVLVPAVLMLDEPAAGLDSVETSDLIGPITDLAADGVGVLLIDHDVDFVARTCSTTYALDFGKVIEHGPTADVLTSAGVSAAYLGQSAPETISAGVR